MSKVIYKPHPFTPEIEQEVYREQNGRCINCGSIINLIRDRPDHIIPQTKTMRRIYGDELIYSKENCQIPCLNCHANKSCWSKQKQKDLMEKWKLFNKSKLKS